MPNPAATPLPRVLVSGIDTLEVFSRGAVTLEAAARLEEAKHWAVDGGAPVDFEVAGHRFKLAARGGRHGIPFLLESQDTMAVKVQPRALKGWPQVQVELRSAFLWQHGPSAAVKRAEEVVGALTAKHFDAAVTRVDLSVDFQGWTPDLSLAFPVPERGGAQLRWSTRARKMEPHLKTNAERTLTGFSFGSGGGIVARVYNKTTEIEEQSGKVWFREVWGASPGYVEGEDVWRVEFQLRRDAFKELRAPAGHLDTWSDVERHAGLVWKYLTGKWLRIPGQRTRKSSRAPAHPVWKAISDGGFAGETWGGHSGDLTRSGRSELLKDADDQFAGHLARVVATSYVKDPLLDEESAIWEAVERARGRFQARGTSLEERAQERATAHLQAAASVLDAKPPPPPELRPLPFKRGGAPAPVIEAVDLTPAQPELRLEGGAT